MLKSNLFNIFFSNYLTIIGYEVEFYAFALVKAINNLFIYWIFVSRRLSLTGAAYAVVRQRTLEYMESLDGMATKSFEIPQETSHWVN